MRNCSNAKNNQRRGKRDQSPVKHYDSACEIDCLKRSLFQDSEYFTVCRDRVLLLRSAHKTSSKWQEAKSMLQLSFRRCFHPCQDWNCDSTVVLSKTSKVEYHHHDEYCRLERCRPKFAKVAKLQWCRLIQHKRQPGFGGFASRAGQRTEAKEEGVRSPYALLPEDLIGI